MNRATYSAVRTFRRAALVSVVIAWAAAGTTPHAARAAQTLPAATAPSPASSASRMTFAPSGVAELKLRRATGLWLTNDVAVNGQKLGWFLVDTGASRSLLDRSAASKLGWSSTANGRLRQPRFLPFNAKTVGLADAAVADVQMAVGDLSSLKRIIPVEVAGILGGDVFGAAPFTVDAQAGTLTFHDPAKFAPPAGVEATPITVDMQTAETTQFAPPPPNTGVPLVKVPVAGRNRFALLDTGASAPVSLKATLTARAPDLIAGDRARLPPVAGVGDSGVPYPANLPALSLFGRDIAGPLLRGSIAYRADPDQVDPISTGADLVVGGALLGQFRLTFDYAQSKLWAEWRPLPTVAERIKTAAIGDVNARDLADQTPLMVAAEDGDAAAVEALLAAGAKADAEECHGMTVLHFAVRGGDDAVVKLIAERPEVKKQLNSRTVTGVTPAMIAAMRDASASLKLLADLGADLRLADRDKQTALHYAAGHGAKSTALFLIGAKADNSARTSTGLTPLLAAGEGGSVEIVEALLAAGASFTTDDRGNTILHAAARQHGELVKHLLAKHAKDVQVDARNRSGMTPLMTAAFMGNADAAAVLLDAGADVNVAADGSGGATPLITAAIRGHAPTVKLLIARGAKLEAATTEGHTALITAALLGNTKAAGELVGAGADLSAREAMGMTPLHAAAKEGQLAVADLLVKAGAKLEATARHDARPLHLACLNGHAAVVKLLLDAGADPTAATDDGATPIRVAQKEGYPDIARLLTEAIGKRAATQPTR